MKILYGVCGEGYGHSSRALVLADYLEKKGHEVRILTYGKAYKVLKKRFNCTKVSGLHLVFEKSILKKRKTIKKALKILSENIHKWKKFHKLMKEFNPELCISDMEPIVPILRNWYHKPLICFDNQHRLTHFETTIPKEYKKDFLIAREVTNSFVKKADYFVITSFTKSKIKKEFEKNTFIVPPPIRKEVVEIKKQVRYENKILVYLTSKDKKTLKILEHTGESFVVYGYNKNKKKGKIDFKTREHFLKDLKNCKAVISTAGFTLMSEAIYLNKPFLALPLKGQFEQVLNALFLKKAGFGDFTEELTEKEIVYFLYNLEKYKKNLKKHKTEPFQIYRVFDKILNKIEKSL